MSSDSVCEFSDSYWRAALNQDGKTWPFEHLYPCVPLITNEERDIRIAKARLKYAPYDLAAERPLLLADLSAQILFRKTLLITNHKIYCKGRAAVTIAYPGAFKVHKYGDGVRLEFPGEPEKHQWEGMDTQRDSTVLGDFLERLLGAQTFNKNDVKSLVDPSFDNSFVTELRNLGVDYATQRLIANLPLPDEHVVHRFGEFILTDRRLITTNFAGCAPRFIKKLRLEVTTEFTEPPKHAHPHVPHHEILTLLLLPLVSWANKDNDRHFKPEILRYKFNVGGGDLQPALIKGKVDAKWKKEFEAFVSAAKELGVEVDWRSA